MAEDRHFQPDDDPTGAIDPIGLLYRSDVYALRAADTVIFHTSGAGACIDACLSSAAFTEPRIYTTRQQRLFPDGDRLDRRRRISVAADIAGFGTDHRWHEHHLPGAAAVTVIDACGLHEVWRTITSLLRPDDVVRLHWRADATTDAVADPDLHRDELRLSVLRGQRRWMFMLDVQLRPEPARMITVAQHPSVSGAPPAARHCTSAAASRCTIDCGDHAAAVTELGQRR
ncbi:hypothetical protein ACPPVO_22165 [Dactylosporangium sp. McL0621]|uniref:hypothetical protein n=1 Tax=Dactylosporangium sp. McL0621 TaxID=3415678 RepID=UPI003CEE89E6